MPALFLSHASANKAFALEVRAHLEIVGYTVFVDQSGIAPGEAWERTLYTELRQARALVVLLTAEARGSKWVFAEVTQARAYNRPLLQVVLDAGGPLDIASDYQALMPAEPPAVPDAAEHTEVDVEVGAESRQTADRILEALRGLGLPPESVIHWNGEDPFPGFSPYAEEHAGVFVGRENEIADAQGWIDGQASQRRPRGLWIVGDSGTGKSSLLRAGLLARMRLEQRWRVGDAIRPGQSNWRAAMSAQPEGVGRRVIALDQLEELAQQPDERIAAVRDALRGPLEEGALVIATVRSSYADGLARRLGMNPALLRLKPLSTAELTGILQRVADRIGWKVHADAAAGLIERATGAMPLLSYAIRWLWNRSGRGRDPLDEALTSHLPPFPDLIARVVEDRLEQLGDLAILDNPSFWIAWLRMAAVKSANDVLRTTVSSEELQPEVREAFRALTPEVLTEHEGGFEPAHEGVFEAWPRLRGCVRDNRRAMLVRDQLDIDATQWELAVRDGKAHGRGAGRFAWPLARTEEAMTMLLGEDSFVEPRSASPGREFLKASLAEARRHLRVRRALAGAVAAVSVVLLAGAVYASLREATTARNTAETEKAHAGEMTVALRDAKEAEKEAIARGRQLGVTLALLAGDPTSAGGLLGSAGHDDAAWTLEATNEVLQGPLAAWVTADGLMLAHAPQEHRALLASGTDVSRLELASDGVDAIALEGKLTESWEEYVTLDLWYRGSEDDSKSFHRPLDALRFNIADWGGGIGVHPAMTRLGALSKGAAAYLCDSGEVCVERIGTPSVVRIRHRGDVRHVAWTPRQTLLTSDLADEGGTLYETSVGARSQDATAVSAGTPGVLPMESFDEATGVAVAHEFSLLGSETYEALSVYRFDPEWTVKQRAADADELVRWIETPGVKFLRADVRNGRIVSAHDDGSLRLTDAAAEQLDAVTVASHRGVADVRWGSEGRRLISVGGNEAAIWTLEKPAMLWRPLWLSHGDATLTFGQLERRRALTVDTEARVWLWALWGSDWELVGRIAVPDGDIRYAGLDGNWVITATYGGRVAVTGIPSVRKAPGLATIDEDEHEVRRPDGTSRALPGQSVSRAAVDAAGECYVRLGDAPAAFRMQGGIWTRIDIVLTRRQEISEGERYVAIGCGRPAVVFSDSQRHIVVQEPGTDTKRLQPTRAQIDGLAISPDGEWVAAVVGEVLEVFRPRVSEERYLELRGHVARIRDVRFDADGVLWSRGGDGWRSWVLDPDEAARRLSALELPCAPARSRMRYLRESKDEAHRAQDACRGGRAADR